MQVNHALVVNFIVAIMSFNAIRENKILTKIFEIYMQYQEIIPTWLAFSIMDRLSGYFGKMKCGRMRLFIKVCTAC